MFLKKVNVENYKNLIRKIILNEKITEEIINKIDYFSKNGKIMIDGYNLYAKSKNGKEFLELKYVDNNLLCNYTEWDFSKFVTISLKNLKSNCVKLERKEKEEYKCNGTYNKTKIEETEEIYCAEKTLLYESKFTNDIEYDTFDNGIEYLDNHYFSNYFDLNKKWYIFNGSIINYKLSKSVMNENSVIEEKYSICPEKYSDGFMTYYNYIDLDEELFKEFMLGSISIDELLQQIDKDEFIRMLKKNISKVDII